MTKGLDCTPDQHDHLHNAINESRVNAKFIKVDRTALKNLLYDHAKLIEVIEPNYKPYRS